MDVAGKRVTVMGLGRHGGGAGAARWLAESGARVTITDRSTADALQPTIAQLAGTPIDRWRLGEHDEHDFRSCDYLVVNPAVHPDNPLVQLAAECGARLTSEIELFLTVCPARVVGVTGSVGKSSTATMLHQIFQAAGARSWLGGNIGGSLLAEASRMPPRDVVVLELSSFQLYWLGANVRMPELAVVTSCTPNHLDWHPTLEHYRHAKQRLLAGQRPDDQYVIASALADGVADDAAWQRPWPGRRIANWPLGAIGRLTVPGRHQRENAALAAAAASAAGCHPAAIAAGLAAFRGLPHRLESLGVLGGREFIDDSKATTPASTLAAMDAIEGSAWWLIGGADKGSNFELLIDRLAERAAGAAFFGATGPRLFQLASAREPPLNCVLRETLADALRWCWQSSHEGESIVLSPACASLDQFRDYVHRGEAFCEWSRALATSTGARPASE